MEQNDAQRILTEHGVVIGPDDDRTEQEIVIALVEKGVIQPDTNLIMAGTALRGANLPPLKKGRHSFAR